MSPKEYFHSTCFHCGNTGLLEISNIVKNREYEYASNGQPCYWYETTWYTLICPTCKKIVLIKRFTEEGDVIQNSDGELEYNYMDVICYPKVLSEFKNTPKEIKELYEASLKTMNISDQITAMSLRMTLEKICINQGATQSKLVEQIKELSDKNILPATLNNCSTIIRKIGNIGAHDTYDFPHNVVEELSDYLYTIIYYLYELPAKVQKLGDKYKEKI